MSITDFAGIIELPSAQVTQIVRKLKQLKNSLPSTVKNVLELQSLFDKEETHLNELQTLLKNGYLRMISSDYCQEKELAPGFSDAGGAVISFLRKMELYSEFLPKLRNGGVDAILSYFQTFFNALYQCALADMGYTIIPEIRHRFKSSSENLSKLMYQYLELN